MSALTRTDRTRFSSRYKKNTRKEERRINTEQHIHISSEHRALELKLGELWRYRDLVLLFTKRTFKVSYAQTVLGPLWILINPLLTSLVYIVLFGNIAKLSTDGLPQILFYLLGSAVWGFFSTCVSKNASAFTANARLFEKVYFPRLAVPVSSVLSAAVQLAVQLVLVLVLIAFYAVRGAITPHWLLWLTVPLAAAQLGILGMSFGIIISSLTTKYRDLGILVGFGLQLWMYASPVVYPLSAVSGWVRTVLYINPVTAPLELIRLALLGSGTVLIWQLVVSAAVTVIAAVAGIAVFNRVERTFADTV